MSTTTTILEPDADGSVHLPLPLELRHSMVKVTATVEVACSTVKVTATIEPAGAMGQPRFGFLAGKIELAPDFDEPLEDFKDYME